MSDFFVSDVQTETSEKLYSQKKSYDDKMTKILCCLKRIIKEEIERRTENEKVFIKYVFSGCLFSWWKDIFL